MWHDNMGEIKGRSDGVGGFSGDPMDPGTTDPQAIAIRNYFLTDLGLLGPIPYDCPCDPNDVDCTCSGPALNDHYVDNGNLVAKATTTIKIDGNVVNSGDTLERAPGSFLNLQLEATTPDGHQVALRFEEALLTNQSNPVLTFTDGASDSILLKTPAQGLVGIVGVYADRHVCPVYLIVRGWA